VELKHLREPGEQAMDTFPQGAGTLAMDHPYPANPLAKAFGEVFRQQFPELRGPEDVQVR
jgi:hypothetical protein